jgi:hypothetical protein
MKIMKKTGDRNSAFYEEERDIMARSTSSWLTKLDYAFQVIELIYTYTFLKISTWYLYIFLACL